MSTTTLAILTAVIVSTTLVVTLILAAMTVATIRKNPHIQRGTTSWLVGSLIIWLVAAIWFSLAGGLNLLAIPLVVGPIAIGTVLSFVGPFRELLRNIPTHWLVFIQFYRIEGAIFLYLHHFEGQLSSEFAFNAGVGDILTGLAAIPVGWLAMQRVRGYRAFVVAWCLFGIADLIVAPASAIMYGAPGLNAFPVVLIPLYVGPPLGTLLHILCLRNVYLQQLKGDRHI